MRTIKILSLVIGMFITQVGFGASFASSHSASDHHYRLDNIKWHKDKLSNELNQLPNGYQRMDLLECAIARAAKVASPTIPCVAMAASELLNQLRVEHGLRVLPEISPRDCRCYSWKCVCQFNHDSDNDDSIQQLPRRGGGGFRSIRCETSADSSSAASAESSSAASADSKCSSTSKGTKVQSST